MKLIREINEMKDYIRRIKGKKIIALVPTMGYLHKGHLSLIRKAKEECNEVVASIFVNPAQFGPAEDYRTYPRDLERDKKLSSKEGVDVIFVPFLGKIYPQGYSTFINVEGRLSSILEGASRPSHFRGVATVVVKLFNITSPDYAYFGEKDYQQTLIIKKMVRDLNMDVKIVTLPTVREKDGLAVSSRNSYFNEEEREAATLLYRSLKKAKKWILRGERESSQIILKMRKLIEKEPLAKIDYIAIVDPDNMEEVQNIEGEVLIALAVKIGKVRLIDNMRVRGDRCQS
ncbi:MAG: pantoate--beta-alanine ligase [Candidatus Aerophobetes bacterium]|nr:pantoate--beta-alanine ligase [Candidatus Aerophobetes bacterium]